jgi:hypothetical protein
MAFPAYSPGNAGAGDAHAVLRLKSSTSKLARLKKHATLIKNYIFGT